MDKKTFKGTKSRTHTEKVSDHFDKTSAFSPHAPEDSVDRVYDYLDNNYDPVMNYKNGAVIKYKKHSGFGYRGRNIEYVDGFARTKFVDSFGDELVKENGKWLRSECTGHLKVEVWGNEFDLEIETASGTIVEMVDMDIRLLKKLNNFLNYALNDKLIQQKGEEEDA